MGASRGCESIACGVVCNDLFNVDHVWQYEIADDLTMPHMITFCGWAEIQAGR